MSKSISELLELKKIYEVQIKEEQAKNNIASNPHKIWGLKKMIEKLNKKIVLK